jgi:hypothetical protein
MKGHDVRREEVTGQEGRGLDFRNSLQVSPVLPVRARDLAEEDVSDSCRRRGNADDREFTVDPAISLGRVLSGQSDHQPDRAWAFEYVL